MKAHRAKSLVVITVLLVAPLQARTAHERLLVFDLTEDTPTAVSVDAEDMACTTTPGSTQTLQVELDNACRPGGTGDPGLVRPKISCLRPKSTPRWVSHRDDILRVYVFYKGKEDPAVAFDEKARKSRLAVDVATLAKLAFAIGRAGTSEAFSGGDGTKCQSGSYTLQRERATLTVSATQPLEGAPPVASTGEGMGGTAAPAASPARKEPRKVQVALTTGPKEHLFISADAPIMRVKQLKYNKEKDVLESTEAPAKFYVGLNYAVGDLQADPDQQHLSVALKAMISGSKTPFESVGFGVALRGKLLMNFDTASPFVAGIYTRKSTDEPDPALGARSKGVWTFLAGLSLNLDQALTWVKGGDK